MGHHLTTTKNRALGACIVLLRVKCTRENFPLGTPHESWLLKKGTGIFIGGGVTSAKGLSFGRPRKFRAKRPRQPPPPSRQPKAPEPLRSAIPACIASLLVVQHPTTFAAKGCSSICEKSAFVCTYSFVAPGSKLGSLHNPGFGEKQDPDCGTKTPNIPPPPQRKSDHLIALTINAKASATCARVLFKQGSHFYPRNFSLTFPDKSFFPDFFRICAIFFLTFLWKRSAQISRFSRPGMNPVQGHKDSILVSRKCHSNI